MFRFFSLGLKFVLLPWFFVGGECFAHGDLHERIAVASRKIEERPLDAQLYVRRADLERQHENWPAAMKDYDRARELDPAINLDFQRGRTLLEAGSAKDALPLLDRALRNTPDDPEVLRIHARALSRLGRREEAAAEFGSTLARTPVPDPELVVETAESLVVLGLQKEAIHVLSAGIAKIGAHPALVIRSMDLAISARDFDTALHQVEVMRQGAPRPEPWLARRACILAQAGRVEESRVAWQAMIDHLTALPNLDRGSAINRQWMADAQRGLGKMSGVHGDPETLPKP
jgi:tetratricopeptide (TPR) repeat protein